MQARALVRDPAACDVPLPAMRADLREAASLLEALDEVDQLFLLTPHGPDQDLLEANAVAAARAAQPRQ